MYNSQYYTCEQIDQRLLQGYLDDYNSQNNTNLTKEQFLTLLFNTIGRNSTVDNLVTQIGYYECDTAGSTAAKAITVANYALFAGGSLKVKFINKNTANNATLNINSQGAKALYYQGERASATNSWDAEEVVEIYYDGTSYYANNVEGNFKDGIFDISAYNLTEGQPAKYEDLAAALGTNGANVPLGVRRGGMSVKFVQTADNNYVQFRCKIQSFSIYIEDWIEVGSEMTETVNNHFRKPTNVCSGIVEYPEQAINSSGELIDNPSYNVSELFPVKSSTEYAINQITFLAYYNASKQFVSRPNITTATVTTPSNVKFARVVSNKNPSTWQLNEGDTLLSYEKPDALYAKNVAVETDTTFTQKGRAADSYAIGTTRNLITLKVIAVGGIASQLNIGEYGFNSSTNKVVYKLGSGSTENIDYVNINPNVDCRYFYNGDIYIWNGTSLIKDNKDEEIADLKNEIYFTDLTVKNNVHKLKTGRTYRFINTCSANIAIYLRVSENSENITLSNNLLPRNYVDYTATVDTNIVRIGSGSSTVSVRIIDKDTLSGVVYSLPRNGVFVIKNSASSIANLLELLDINEYGFVINTSQTKLAHKISASDYEYIDLSENDSVYVWNDSIYKWNGTALVDVIQTLREDVESIDLNLYGRTLTQSNETITLQQGKTYVFTNNGTADVALNARVTQNGSNVPIAALLGVGESVTYVAAQTTYYLVIGSSAARNVFVSERVGNKLNMELLASFNTTPNTVQFKKRHTYKFINKGYDCNLILKDGDIVVWQHQQMRPYEEDIVTLDADVNTVVIGSAGQRLVEVYDMEALGGIIPTIKQGMDYDVPVDFDMNEEIEDISSDFSTFDFSDTEYQEDMMEQIYTHMDKLCALYPDFVKKYDPMASADINQTVTIDGTDYTIVIRAISDVKSAMSAKGFSDYPEYANGISSPITRTLPKGDGTTYEVTYDITPAYKTYLYTFISEDSNLVGDYVKRKVFLTGGVHANERISPVNLCILAKKLCESTDENAYKLRVACDYYIIPFVNGYSCYHTRRGNANWVDINRNYPTKDWVFRTNGLDERDRWRCIYSGPEAGSEFETNLVMSVFNYIKPDLGIDHHNYSNSQQQFYVEYGGNYRPVLMRAATDTFKALQKKYQSDFGNDYKLFLYSDSIRITRAATTDMFMRENTDNNAALTIEVSQCVNYVNGVYTSSPTETFNGKVANIAYYTLKHLLMVLIDNFYKKYGMVKNM